MTKRKRNILIIVTLGVIVLLAAAVGVVYAAYSVLVNYNYDFQAHADVLSISYSGTDLTITRQPQTALRATRADAVIITRGESGDVTLTDTADSSKVYPAYTFVTFTEGSTVYRKSVFTDLGLSASSVSSSFSVSTSVTAVVKAAMSEAYYEYDENGDGTISADEKHTVIYDNIFVSNHLDFELMNFQSNYNNIFELWNNYSGREIVSRTVYLLDDIEIPADYKINVPCSLNLLTSTLSVGSGAKVTLAHSYAGAYYVTGESVTVGATTFTGTVDIASGGSFTVNTPKAYYRVDSALLAKGIVVAGYGDAYIGDVLDDALDFALDNIPGRFFATLVLQQHFQTYGVDYAYYFKSIDAVEYTGFSGRVVSAAAEPVENDALKRNAVTTAYDIKVVATSGGTNKEAVKRVSVIGSGEAAMLTNILDDISDNYYAPSPLRLDIDLNGIIRDAYAAGGFAAAINISVYETMYGENGTGAQGLEAEAAALAYGVPAKLVVGYLDGSEMVAGAARKLTVGYNRTNARYDGDGYVTYNGKEVKYLVINKGIATISDELTVKLSSAGATAVTRNYSLAVSARGEIVQYLKSVTPAFLTNKPYPVLTYKSGGASDGIYSGLEMLTSSLLGLDGITHKFVYRTPDEDDETILIDEDAPTYVNDGITYIDGLFYYDPAENAYVIVDEKMTVPDNLYLRYEIAFPGGAQPEAVYLKVIKSLASDGGDNQQFESSNPFDELFMSSETVWVEGGTFEVSSTGENYYAQIEIVSINGTPYDTAAPDTRQPSHNMISVVCDQGAGKYDSAADPSLDAPLITDGAQTTFYKKITVVTDRDYVPDYNVSVRFRCYYVISAGANSAIVLRQDYLVTVNGIFKCEKWEDEDKITSNLTTGMTGYAFYDTEFYRLTVQMFEDAHGENASAYVSTMSSGVKILLSDSAYATGELDYRGLNAQSAVDVRGIERLKRVTSINLSGILIKDMYAFSQMADSALEKLYLKGCEMDSDALYASSAAEYSYLYEIHLKTVDLSDNKLTRTDKLLSRTVTSLDISGQRSDSNVRCLIDIAGLSNLTSLKTLYVHNNGIYRFEVLRKLSTLEAVYLYGNVPPDGDIYDYGTDGRINIPHYVAAIKDYAVKIYANTTDYIRIDRTVSTSAATGFNTVASLSGTQAIGGSYAADMNNYFTGGGKLTAEMEIGSVAVNAFGTPTKIYSTGSAGSYLNDGLGNLIYDVSRLKVGDGWNGGVDGDVATQKYWFRFYDHVSGTLSDTTVTLMNDSLKTQFTRATIVIDGQTGDISATAVGSAIPAGTVCSYMLAVVDASGNILAYREFLVTVMYHLSV